MVRARIREDEGLAAVCRRFWGHRWWPTVAVVSEMAGRGHGKRRSPRGPDWRELAGRSVGRRRVSGGWAPSGWEWNGSQPGRARLNFSSQGQRLGRCRVRRRAERVSRPARERKRRRRVLMVTTCSPKPMRAVQRARLWAIT